MPDFSCTYPRIPVVVCYNANHMALQSSQAHGKSYRLPIIISLLVVGICLVSCLPLGSLVGLFAYYQAFDIIFPGVAVGRDNLQGETIQQASIELHKTWNMEKQIQVMDGLHTWSLAPADLGLSMDALQTAKDAHRVGRGYSLLGDIGQMVYSMRNGWKIYPVIVFDAQQANAMLVLLNQQARKPAETSSIHLEGDRIVVVPGKLGYELNIEDALRILNSDPAGILVSGTLRLPLKPIAPEIVDFSSVMNQAQALLDRPITLHGYDPINDEQLNWPVPREIVASWLTLQTGEAGQEIGIEAERVASYLTTLNTSLDPVRYIDTSKYSQPVAEAVREGNPFTILISHKPTQYVVKPGDTLLKIGWRLGMPYWMILNANPDLNPDKLPVGQNLLVPSKDELLPLPVVENKRIVISISQQRLWAYQDGKLIAKHPISTGIDRSPTQPGIFQVQSHERKAYASIWDLTMPYFLGVYEAWPGFYNGIHGLPTLANGRRLWANILGRPASFGCIILDLKAAKDLYEWAENGVIVEIKP